jgi:hypothetical protein
MIYLFLRGNTLYRLHRSLHIFSRQAIEPSNSALKLIRTIRDSCIDNLSNPVFPCTFALIASAFPDSRCRPPVSDFAGNVSIRPSNSIAAESPAIIAFGRFPACVRSPRATELYPSFGVSVIWANSNLNSFFRFSIQYGEEHFWISPGSTCIENFEAEDFLNWSDHFILLEPWLS